MAEFNPSTAKLVEETNLDASSKVDFDASSAKIIEEPVVTDNAGSV